MRIKDYLDEILNLITEHPFIVSQSLSFEERPPDSAFITGTVTFTDATRLHLLRGAEYCLHFCLASLSYPPLKRGIKGDFSDFKSPLSPLY
jgi:hypothetical protein